MSMRWNPKGDIGFREGGALVTHIAASLVEFTEIMWYPYYVESIYGGFLANL